MTTAPLYGVTHTLKGEPISRLAKALKVSFGFSKGKAIHAYIDAKGLWCVQVGVGKDAAIERFRTRDEAEKHYIKSRPVAPERQYPGKLGYFTFTRIGRDGDYVHDFDAIEQHGSLPTSVGIVFLSNAPLMQAYEYWTAAELKCRGDGRNAVRRCTFAQGDREKAIAAEHAARGEKFFPIVEGCAARGCPFAGGEKRACKPHSRLEFQLQRSPAFGSACVYDSTGYRSAVQLFSSMRQIKTITGRGNPESGTVAGIPLQLRILAYRTSHDGKPVQQYGVTLHLEASDAVTLMRQTIAAGDEYKRLSAGLIEAGGAPDDLSDDTERVPETQEAALMTGEFYPEAVGAEQVDETAENMRAFGTVKRKSETTKETK